ncbi:MAG: VOC family protein [Parvularculaceae bacterium]
MPRPTHFEIHADDPERAIKFYTDVFGWTFDPFGAGEQPYWLAVTGPDDARGINGGLMKRMGSPPGEQQPVSAYVCSMDVDDLDAYSSKVKDAGGNQAVDKMAIPGVGWLAYFKDTEGNIFGLMQPDPEAK